MQGSGKGGGKDLVCLNSTHTHTHTLTHTFTLLWMRDCSEEGSIGDMEDLSGYQLDPNSDFFQQVVAAADAAVCMLFFF